MTIPPLILGRSIFRMPDSTLPRIQVRYPGDSKTYEHAESHYESILFTIFDEKHFEEHLLPKTEISFRNQPDKSVSGSELAKEIEHLKNEIKSGKKKFRDFIVLKDGNFNYYLRSGFIVLKFKKYPFIVKLSIETPQSFTDPFSKGFEPRFFFYMAGGVNRHMTGLTRIKNLEKVLQKLRLHPEWSAKVDFPRKWFWTPKERPVLEITGHNIGEKSLNVKIPAIYAVVADEIQAERIFTIFDPNDRKTALDICNYVDHHIDAHINNFRIEKDTNKIVVIDTEHFPTVVGLRELPGDNYIDWFAYLSKEMVKRTFCRNKYERQQIQKRKPSRLAL